MQHFSTDGLWQTFRFILVYPDKTWNSTETFTFTFRPCFVTSSGVVATATFFSFHVSSFSFNTALSQNSNLNHNILFVLPVIYYLLVSNFTCQNFLRAAV